MVILYELVLKTMRWHVSVGQRVTHALLSASGHNIVMLTCARALREHFAVANYGHTVYCWLVQKTRVASRFVVSFFAFFLLSFHFFFVVYLAYTVCGMCVVYV